MGQNRNHQNQVQQLREQKKEQEKLKVKGKQERQPDQRRTEVSGVNDQKTDGTPRGDPDR